MTPRTIVAVVFLALQAALVVVSQFGESRWFSLAPHTTQVRYRIDATADGRRLGDDEFRRRHGIPAAGWEVHAIQNVKDIVMQHARTHGRNERVSITMRYSINGRPEQGWTWSSDQMR